MMLYPAMSKLSEHIPNRYMLVNVVARRARQIAEAYEAAGEPLNKKPVTIAIDEVADGILSTDPPPVLLKRSEQAEQMEPVEQEEG